jgi:2-methylcitrate dehydratase PrpD
MVVMTHTKAILDFAAAPHILPAQVWADTERLLADTLAVGAAGSSASGAGGVLAVARSFGVGDAARVLGRDDRLPAASAAYVSAFQIHCLEWDAVHEPAVVHALSVVTAALGAAIDRRGGCDDNEALCALAVGVDIASGLGIAADSALSFFRPATAGLIGAALAVARIEGLTRAQFNDVLGLAYSHCAGTMQAHVEASIALPLQIAAAARSAVHVVDLVKHGLTGPHDALEGPFGYFALFDRGDLSRYTRQLGQVWLISEVSTKPYPSGRASHAVLGALGDVRDSGRTITAIKAHVPPLIARLVGRPMIADMTPAYARLCLPLLCALMLRDGRIDPRRFTSETFNDPAIWVSAEQLEIILDANPDLNALSPQRIEISFGDGSIKQMRISNALGSPDTPMNAAQSTQKRDLCEVLSLNVDRRLFDTPLVYFTEPV